jgi:hypothetical protein
MTLTDVFSSTAGKKLEDLMKIGMSANIDLTYKNMLNNMTFV